MLVTELVVHPWLDTRFATKMHQIDPDLDVADVDEYVQERLIFLRAQDAFRSECLGTCCIAEAALAAFEAFMLTEDSDAFQQGYAFAAEWLDNQQNAYRQQCWYALEPTRSE